MKGCFVTGTDTEIGKTVVAAGIAHAFVGRGLRTAVMKPVASGGHETEAGLRNEDAERMIAASNVAANYAEVNPYCFAPPIAPHIAAAEAGVAIDTETILHAARSLAARADVLVVEGVGGWRVPLAPDFDVAALATALGLPVVLVVGLRLGCLNHALLSAEAIRAAGCTLAGWVANEIDPAMERRDKNIATLRAGIAAPCLGTVPRLEAFDPRAVAVHLSLGPLLENRSAARARDYRGGCHCGNFRVVFSTARAPETWALRMCQCSFCRAHGAVMTTDPAGKLAVTARDPAAVLHYRFGLANTDFLICTGCGAYVAAVADIEGGRYATLNVNVLDVRSSLAQMPIAVNYEGEEASQRLSRRRCKWTPATTELER